MHELNLKQGELNRRKQQQSYADELNKAAELKKANLNFEKQAHDLETSELKNRWNKQSNIERSIYNQDKNFKLNLSQGLVASFSPFYL